MREQVIHARPWYPALDGVRGIAIIGILVCHNFDMLPFAEYGRTGVDLFFVLSGYLITDILLRTKDSPRYMRNFFARRVLRIFPLYFFTVILFFLFAGMLPALQEQVHYYSSHSGYVWLHVQNWLYFLHTKPAGPSPLMNHFWSLSLEEQFYLLWPAVLLLFRRMVSLEKFLLLLIGASVTARLIGWEMWGDGYRFFYFQSIARLDGFAIGGLIAVWLFTGKPAFRKLLKLILILVLLQIVAFIISRIVQPGFPHMIITGLCLISALYGLLVTVSITGKNKLITTILSRPWLRIAGKYSYGIYVYHWPVLILSKIYCWPVLLQWIPARQTAALVHGVWATFITLLLSAASYEFFEKRFLSLKTRFAN